MALSRITKVATGLTNQFAVNFALGYIDEAHVTARVGEEVDGLGAPVYRAITFLTPTLLEADGELIAVDTEVVFERTVPNDDLLVNFNDGDQMTEANLDVMQMQLIMLMQQAVDGRIGPIASDFDMDGFRIKNVGDPLVDGDVVTWGYLKAEAGNAVSAAAIAVAAAGTATTKASDSTTQAGIATNAAGVATSEAADGLAHTLLTEADAISTAADRVAVANDRSEVAANTAAVASDANAASIARVGAEAALDATLLAYDQFDDRYLGPKGSDPALDNDGNAILAGALYYNTVVPAMMLYTGAGWVFAYVSGASYLASANNLSDVASAASARNNLGLGTAATRNVTISTAAPSGGSDGDLWFQYVP